MKPGAGGSSPTPIIDGLWLDDTCYPMRSSGLPPDGALHLAFNIRALTREHLECPWYEIDVHGTFLREELTFRKRIAGRCTN